MPHDLGIHSYLVSVEVFAWPLIALWGRLGWLRNLRVASVNLSGWMSPRCSSGSEHLVQRKTSSEFSISGKD